VVYLLYARFDTQILPEYLCPHDILQGDAKDPLDDLIFPCYASENETFRFLQNKEHSTMSQIRDLRKKAKLKQCELAAKAGVSIPTICRMERLENSKPVVKASLICVCSALGVDPKMINDVRVRGVFPEEVGV